MFKVITLSGLFFVCAAAILGIVELCQALAARRRHVLAVLSAVAYGLVLTFQPDPPVVGGIVGIVAAASIGHLLGSTLVSTAPGLIAFLVTASVVDLTSVASGPTKALFDASAAGTGDLVLYLAILLPWDGQLISALGVSDLLGLSVLFASLRAQDFGRISTFLFGLGGLFAALGVTLTKGGVAGYPFLAAAAIAALLFKKYSH